MSKITHIGGQALIEGIMMRGKNCYTLAVRTPENEIFTEDTLLDNKIRKNKISKLPIIRGMFAFVDSMIIGSRCMIKSAQIAGEDEEESISDFAIYISVFLGICFSVFLFMILPSSIGGLLTNFLKIDSPIIISLVEGFFRLSILFLYLFLISKMPDIKTVFMYHGAEHKTIACFEADKELTVENVRDCTRVHKRCGTSFLLIVALVSVVFFMFFNIKAIWLRILSRIIFVPFVAGISYEIIKYAGSHDSPIVNALSRPGLLLQKLTTIEPTDDQIEVAICAMKGVLDIESSSKND